MNKLKQLYKEGFDDTDEYVDFFFDLIVKNENTIYHTVDNQIVSAGYIIEKPAYVFDKVMTVPYLSALSTAKHSRGKGYIENVIKDAFTTLYNRGQLFTLLYPFDHNYYKRYGYTDISFCKTKQIIGGHDYDFRIATDKDYYSIKNIYAKMMNHFNSSLLLTDEMLLLKLKEYAVDGIDCFILSDSYGDFAFGFVEDKEIPFYATTDSNAFKKADKLKGLYYKDFFDATEPYAQGRVLNAKRLLEIYPYSKNLNINIKIGIIDPYIKDNNINCKLKIENGRAVLSDCESVDRIFSIDEFTKNVFCGDGFIFKSIKNCFIDKY